MIRSFGSRALRNFWARGTSEKIDPAIQVPLLRRLDVLDAALRTSELRAAGLGLLSATGKPSRECRVHVASAWTLRFEWAGACAGNIRLRSNTSNDHADRDWKARTRVRAPTHPGAVLREDILPASCISIIEAAARLEVSRQTLHRILAETASVTPEMAIRLSRFCGNGPAIWLRMQQAHDLWWAEQTLRGSIGAAKNAA